MVCVNWIDSAASACSLYLLIEFIDDAFCPLQVQVADFGRSIDVCQLDTHLAHQQSVILIGPINSRTVHIIHLLTNQDGCHTTGRLVYPASIMLSTAQLNFNIPSS